MLQVQLCVALLGLCGCPFLYVLPWAGQDSLHMLKESKAPLSYTVWVYIYNIYIYIICVCLCL